jgi:hypothetical protein
MAGARTATPPSDHTSGAHRRTERRRPTISAAPSTCASRLFLLLPSTGHNPPTPQACRPHISARAQNARTEVQQRPSQRRGWRQAQVRTRRSCASARTMGASSHAARAHAQQPTRRTRSARGNSRRRRRRRERSPATSTQLVAAATASPPPIRDRSSAREHTRACRHIKNAQERSATSTTRRSLPHPLLSSKRGRSCQSAPPRPPTPRTISTTETAAHSNR